MNATPEWSRELARLANEPSFIAEFPIPSERRAWLEDAASYPTKEDAPADVRAMVDRHLGGSMA